MAGVHHWDGGSTQRYWRQHHPPIADGWEDWDDGQHEPTFDALPYRARSRDILRPDGGHALQRSASHRSRPSDDMRPREPSSSRPQGRSVALSRYSTRDTPARAHREQYSSRRARPATQSVSTSTSRSSSADSSSSDTSGDETEDSGMVTPTSAHEDRVTPDSDCSSTISSGSSSSSAAPVPPPPVQRAIKGRAQRKLKEPAQVVLAPRPKSHHHQHDRRRSHKEPAMLEIESEPAREEEKAVRRRHKHHSTTAKRSSSHAHHRHRDSRREVKPASSSKRTTRKKYYESDPSHSDRDSLSRSQTTQSTRSKSTRSKSSSSKRSSPQAGRLVLSHASHAAHASRPAKLSKLVECIACRNEETPRKKTAKLSCGHRMCHHCLKRVFRLSTKDPAHMPPKCCTERPIDLKHVDALFDAQFKKTWNQKLTEFSTSNRIYCPREDCGAWIGPRRVQHLKDGRKKAKCGGCKTEMCVACTGVWHKSRDCPTDEDTLAFLQMAQEENWKTCFKCKRTISLEEGCNHMTCRCGAQFCMVCGAKWKTCECPWFDYEELEDDEPDHSRAYRERSSGGRGERPSRDSRARAHRSRPRTYTEETARRRKQEKEDERLARKLQYYGHGDKDEEDEDDEDDDYAGRYGDIVGIGNNAGHFMNESYRRPQQALVVPPAPHQPHAAPFERAVTADYVSGVNKARGVRAEAMEARLAERFSESRQGQNAGRRAFTHSFPPMAAPPMAPMSVGGGPPSMSMMRRHTMEGDEYGTQSLRLSERMKPLHARFNQSFDAGPYSVGMRPQDSQSSSKLAGLTGIGRGAHRVDEWREFVQPVPPPETVG